MVVAASAVDVAVAVAVAVVMIMTTTTMSGHTSGQCSRDHLEQETCNVL